MPETCPQRFFFAVPRKTGRKKTGPLLPVSPLGYGLSEQEADELVQGRQPDKGVDNSLSRSPLTKDGRDQVEAGESDKAPVQSTDDRKYCGDPV